MITSADFKKKLRKATTDNVSSIRLFLETEGVVTYEQIEKVVGKKDDMGRTIGGILSSLSRTSIEGEPLIISLGPSEDSRRLLWKLNPAITENAEHRKELLVAAEQVMEERK